jgi:hypothetical protein
MNKNAYECLRVNIDTTEDSFTIYPGSQFARYPTVTPKSLHFTLDFNNISARN